MPTTTAPATVPVTQVEDPPRKGRTRLLVIVLVAVLVLGGGAYLLLLRPSGGEAHATEKPVAGAVYDLEPLTVNLADGHFLKVGMSLQLVEGVIPSAAEGDGGVTGAQARDAAVETFGSRTYDQLLSPAGRAAARKALVKKVRKRYPDQVMTVYLTEFVMQ